jgi:hypothetical protein
VELLLQFPDQLLFKIAKQIAQAGSKLLRAGAICFFWESRVKLLAILNFGSISLLQSPPLSPLSRRHECRRLPSSQWHSCCRPCSFFLRWTRLPQRDARAGYFHARNWGGSMLSELLRLNNSVPFTNSLILTPAKGGSTCSTQFYF